MGRLDMKALYRSITEIHALHSSLRSSFHKSEPDPIQIIRDFACLSIERINIANMSEAIREFESVTLCSAEAHKAFDLSHGPLFRWLLLRLGPDEHILVMIGHQIIVDDFSMGIIFREMMSVYAGIVAGNYFKLNAEPFECGKQALHETEWLASESGQSQIFYWRQKFRSIPEALDLPTDFPRPAFKSSDGSTTSLILAGAVYQNIKNLTTSNKVTLFMALMAAFKALMSRYSNRLDICVGTIVPNRNNPELQNCVGRLQNILAIRTELSEDLRFNELLNLVRDNILGALANQDIPFGKLLDEIKPERSLSRTPIFQVMMVLQEAPTGGIISKVLSFEPYEIKSLRSSYDLTMWCYESRDNLNITMEYSTDLFRDNTASIILRHYKTFLELACAAPHTKISDIDFIDPDEKQIILGDFSGLNEKFHTPAPGVVEMFERTARAFPQAVALHDLHGHSGMALEMTYGELYRKTNRLARALQHSGIGPETKVALFLEPFRFLIVAILGTLKSGGAYVPLDTKYPEKRIEYILNDSGAHLIIADQANLERLGKIVGEASLQHRPEIICIDRDWDSIRAFSGNEIANKPDPLSSAYLIYTSGSTGTPKGVIIEHSALADFTRSGIGLYGIAPNDRVLQFASPSFDASVEEIFCSLCSGATLVLRSEASLKAMADFASECSDAEVTVLDLPTAFWQQMAVSLEEGSIVLPQTLRMIIIGGEQPSTERVMAWLKTAPPGIRLINTYGPTETTVVATSLDLNSWNPEDHTFRQIPIGRPLDHVSAYILDKNLKPVPIGVPGELCLGGASLARGYLNLPQKTSDRFIPNPFSENTRDRLYRTGDRVRFLEDGQIEFCGRVDRQVKVRGFRVELDEIDNALRSTPEISEAFSIGFKKDASPVQIVSFVVSPPGSTIEVSEIREDLRNKLPDFMIPSSIVILEKFPLTSGGKIDANVLRQTEFSGNTHEQSFLAPRNPIEEVLVNIWQDVFKAGRIGVKDDFFQLGGHSLLSLQIIDRVNRAGLQLTPAEFIQNPTIEGQARLITTSKPSSGDGPWQCLVQLQAHGSLPPLYLIHSNPGDVLGYVNLVNKLGQDQPCYGFESLSLRDPSRAHKTVEEMAAFYIKEMMAFQPTPPYYLAGWCYGGIVATEMACQLQEMGKKVGLLALIETPFPRMSSARALYYYKKLVGLAKLGPKEWLSYFRNKIRYVKSVKSGRIDGLFSLELNGGVLSNRPSAYRLNSQAMKDYTLKGSLDYPLRLFIGNILEEGFIPDIEDLWTTLSKDVKRFIIEGNHLTILKEPGAGILAKKLRECLAEVEKHN